MDLLELLTGIPTWLAESVWPVVVTVLPWMIEHPLSFIPGGIVWFVLWAFGTALKARDGALRELGLSTAMKWLAVVVALLYIKRNWPIVSGWIKKVALVVVATAWVLIMWRVPRFRWTLFPTAWLAVVVPTLRWAEWTRGKWFGLGAYRWAKERDQCMAGIRAGIRAMYPGSDPKILPGLTDDPFGFTVAFSPGIGQTVGSMDQDAQSGAIGGAIDRMGKRHRMPYAPQSVRVLPGSHEGNALLRVDIHGLAGFDKVVKCPPYQTS